MKEMEIYLLPNLAKIGVSFGSGFSGAQSKLYVSGRTLPAIELAGILAAQLIVEPIKTLDEEDSAYVSAETLAAWLAFLADAPCTVVNRPGPRLNYVWQSPLQVRALARQLGIPTVEDFVASRRSFTRRADIQGGQAFLDLARSASFWWEGPDLLERGHLYSMTGHRRLDDFVVTARVADDCSSIALAADGTVFSCPESVADDSANITLRLLDELGLEYGFAVHSLAQGVPRFSRLLPSAPAFLPKSGIAWVAQRLQQLILNPGSLR